MEMREPNPAGPEGKEDIGDVAVTGNCNAAASASTVVSTSNSPLLSSHKRSSFDSVVDDDDAGNFDKLGNTGGPGHCDPWHVYAHIAKRSQLCAELMKILTQVASTGRVNVKVGFPYQS